jgi:hypothetical protein
MPSFLLSWHGACFMALSFPFPISISGKAFAKRPQKPKRPHKPRSLPEARKSKALPEGKKGSQKGQKWGGMKENPFNIQTL